MNVRAHHGTRYDTGPTIAVNVNGVGAAWNGGVFTATDPDVLHLIEQNAAVGMIVDVYGSTLVADARTPLGALAALASPSPGRVTITACPDDVVQELRTTSYAHPFIPDAQQASDSEQGNDEEHPRVS